MHLALRRHPESQGLAVDRIAVTVSRQYADRLNLSYELIGRPDKIRIPPSSRADRTDELWKQSCFEAFIRASSREDYFEFNLSPSRQWAAYHFKSYRSERQPVMEIDSIPIDFALAAEHLTMRASIDLGVLSSLPDNAVWCFGLAAVIEELSGDKSYWALSHARGKPDFHHSECFVKTLPLSSTQ